MDAFDDANTTERAARLRPSSVDLMTVWKERQKSDATSFSTIALVWRARSESIQYLIRSATASRSGRPSKRQHLHEYARTIR